jgi:hypothetical protein
MARRAAGSGVPEAIAHFGQFANGSVQLLGFGSKHLPVDARPTVRREHERDFIKREACGTPEGDQRQPFQHAGIEHTVQPPPAN